MSVYFIIKFLSCYFIIQTDNMDATHSVTFITFHGSMTLLTVCSQSQSVAKREKVQENIYVGNVIHIHILFYSFSL